MNDLELIRIRHRNLVDRITRHDLLDEVLMPITTGNDSDGEEHLSLSQAVHLTKLINQYNSFLKNSQTNSNNLKSRINDEIVQSKLLNNNRKDNMEQCGLCTHFYHKSSVIHSVSNYRIQGLRKEWNVASASGKKYEFPSFKYSVTKVCCFCAQLFLNDSKENSSNETKGSYDRKDLSFSMTFKTTSSVESTQMSSSIPSLSNPLVLEIVRTDLASPYLRPQKMNSNLNRRTRYYQSSTVDENTAVMAASTPYKIPSKTRRQADPWWEVDLGQKFHVYSIEFTILLVLHQELDGKLMFFSHPVGFDDPFIDSASSKAILCTSFSDMSPTLADDGRSLHFNWILPTNIFVSAVRVQLIGLHALTLQGVHVYQGDDLPPASVAFEDPSIGMYASVSPQFLRNSRKEMRTVSQRRTIRSKSGISTKSEKKGAKFNSVHDFLVHINGRYEKIKDWMTKVSQYTNSFLQSELLVLFRVVFMHCVDADYNEYQQYLQRRCGHIQSAPMIQSLQEESTDTPEQLYSTNFDGLTKDNQIFEQEGNPSRGCVTDNNNEIKFNGISEHDILGSGLVQQFPRCCFSTLISRLVTLLRWIHTKRHTLVLGNLAHNDALLDLTRDVEDNIFKLELEFKRIEKYWRDRVFSKSSDINEPISLFAPASSHCSKIKSSDSLSSPRHIDIELLNGCSWSQFIMIMSLFCSKQTGMIPEVVYCLEPDEVGQTSMHLLSYTLIQPYRSQVYCEQPKKDKSGLFNFIHRNDMKPKANKEDSKSEPTNNAKEENQSTTFLTSLANETIESSPLQIDDEAMKVNEQVEKPTTETSNTSNTNDVDDFKEVNIDFSKFGKEKSSSTSSTIGAGGKKRLRALSRVEITMFKKQETEYQSEDERRLANILAAAAAQGTQSSLPTPSKQSSTMPEGILEQSRPSTANSHPSVSRKSSIKPNALKIGVASESIPTIKNEQTAEHLDALKFKQHALLNRYNRRYSVVNSELGDTSVQGSENQVETPMIPSYVSEALQKLDISSIPRPRSVSHQKLKYLEKKWQITGSSSLPLSSAPSSAPLIPSRMKREETVVRPGTADNVFNTDSSLVRGEFSVDQPLGIFSYHGFNPLFGEGHQDPHVNKGRSGRPNTSTITLSRNLATNDVTNVSETIPSRLRSCALCKLKVSKDSTIRVLSKHVLNLRKFLSSGLGGECEESVDVFSDKESAQGSGQQESLIEDDAEDTGDPDMAMYNLVNLCCFCSQFIDPDKEEGISRPNFELLPQDKRSASSTGRSLQIGKIQPFFDERYQNVPREISAIHQFRSNLSRSRARRALTLEKLQHTQ